MTRCSFAAKNGFDNYIFKFDVPSPFHHEEGHAETGNMQHKRDTKKKQTAMQKQAITRQNKNMLKRTSMPRATTKKPDIPGH